MPLPKVEEARQLDDEALEEAIAATRKRLFELRFQNATRQLKTGLHQFKHEKHRLAQLMTVRNERLLSMTETVAQTESLQTESLEAEVPEATTVIATEEE